MNFLTRCWQRRWIRGIAWTTVTLLTLGALFYSWVNWSGARKWRATQAMLKAEGETLDFRALCNEPIPDAENFCAIPLLKDLALVVNNDVKEGEPAEKRKRLKEINLPRIKEPKKKLGERTDLKYWADALRKEGSLPASADSGNPARDVLTGLAKQDALARELAVGLDRPKAQWTPDWKTADLPFFLSTPLPHLTLVITASQTLRLRGIAAARAGDAARAHESALIIARLAQASLNDPFLISLLVAASASSLLCDTTWELCDAHAGTVEDFTKLETALMGLDFQRATLNAFRSEMAGGIDSFQLIKRDRQLGREFFYSVVEGDIVAQEAASGVFSTRALRVLSNALIYSIPSGWFDASTAVIADFEFKYLIKPLREQGWIEARQVSKDGQKQITAIQKKIWIHPSYILLKPKSLNLTGVIDKAIYSDAYRNQAVIACALERYRIENGNYPESLDGVKLANGAPLPLDVLNGKPMNYRKTADGRYALWSIGFDGNDDNGQRGATDQANPPEPHPAAAEYKGDWVWDFPLN
jgi:hypothetical protein